MPTSLPARAAIRRPSFFAHAIFAALPLFALAIALIFHAHAASFAGASPF
jgi:hypothetical protein